MQKIVPRHQVEQDPVSTMQKTRWTIPNNKQTNYLFSLRALNFNETPPQFSMVKQTIDVRQILK